MFIVPINTVSGISEASQIGKTQQPQGVMQPGGAAEMFKDFFSDALKNVNETAAQTKQDALDLATGNIDDPSSIMINASKAEVALQMFVQIRNLALDAYNEIMRINV